MKMRLAVDLSATAPLVLGCLPFLLACATGSRPEPVKPAAPAPAASTPTGGSVPTPADKRRDLHSFAHPEEVAVEHLKLDLTVDFTRQRLVGRANLRLRNLTGATTLHLDTRDLDIHRVTLDDGRTETPFHLAEPVPFLGRDLAITIAPGTRWVSVDYETHPEAAALQWLSPAQVGGTQPLLFTQSEAILARTWVPCQDSPGVRMTYEATVRVPPGFLALMSAENPMAKSADGVYRFAMPQAIPAYLLALAVGDLEFRPLGPKSGVYALPAVVEKAAWELVDTPKMIAAAEKLYGPYRWGRYDLLILPPSYPFGGMENPRLTFATPTILAGDRSLVALVAHELAHSWSGNLVTNATWNDFWLNEGFTVYFEHRIMEALYGRPYEEMLAVLGRQDLDATIQELGGPTSQDTRLHLDLAGRDPDEGMNDVAYEKGALFLRAIEEAVGRPKFDQFLRGYFDANAFHSMDTATFVQYLHAHLLDATPGLADRLQIDRWIYQPGVPDDAPRATSDAFTKVEAQIAALQAGTAPESLATQGWSTHQWLHFLRNLKRPVPPATMAALDATFHFTTSGNSEILTEWLLRAIESRYEPAYPALEQFLTQVGRRKFLKPLYTELAKTPAGMERALRIYKVARPGYHSVSRQTLDKLLDWRG